MVTMLGQMCSGCECFVILRLKGHSQNGHYASPSMSSMQPPKENIKVW